MRVRRAALAGVFLLAGSVRCAGAHGTDNIVMGSTAVGGGNLVAAYDYATHVLVTPSTTIAGFTIHTSSNPGLTPLLADDPAQSLFVLNDGTTLSFTLAAPLDAGVSVKIGSTVLDAVGETALVGTFDAANPDAFHVHPTWTLTVPAGTATVRQVSFTLTAPGYGASPVYTALLSNIAPTPTTTAGGSPAATPTATPIPDLPAHLEEPAAVKRGMSCARAIRAAAGKHARTTLASLAKCTQAALRCIQLAPGDAPCVGKAGAACAKAVAAIAAREAGLAAKVEKKCAALGVADVRAAGGLGFDDAAAACAAAGAPLAELADVGRCVARAATCRAARLLGAETPRAGEVLRLAGQSVPSLDCLPDRGGTGAGVGDPKGAGKALLTCQRATVGGGAKVVQARLAAAEKCVGALFACVEMRPGDGACLAAAGRACAVGDAKVATAEDKLAAALRKPCDAVPFAALAAAEGANVGALAGECDAYGVAPLATLDGYRECLRRQHACRAADLVAAASPRARELLALVGAALAEPFCPETP